MTTARLPIVEEFISVQGEGRNLGVLYYFIRVGGCSLRCNFCDTEYSWKIKKDCQKNVLDIVNGASRACVEKGIKWVSITGGEPMLYPEQLMEVLKLFRDRGLKTQVETCGRYYETNIHDMCDIWSADSKTPCTGEHRKEDLWWLEKMYPRDQVKCLIHDKEDIEWAYMVNQRLQGRCPLVLQPFNINVSKQDGLTSRTMSLITKYRMVIEMVLEDKRRWHNVIITPQVHVLAWQNTPGK